MACNCIEEDMQMEEEALQRLKDQVLIVVGSGAAVEKLARRRVDAGGRLCVVEADDGGRIVSEELQVSEPPDLWRPPEAATGSDAPDLARKLRARPQLRWLKAGPDVVRLRSDETLHVLQIRGQSVGVRVKADGGETRWEMSGCVLIRPSQADADAFDVTVTDYEALPLSIMDPKDAVIGLALGLVAFAVCYAFSAAFERTATPGQVPLWRVPFCVLCCLLADPFVFDSFCSNYVGDSPPAGLVAQCVAAAAAVSGVLACLGLSNPLLAIASCGPPIAMTQVLYVQTRKKFPGRKWVHQFQWGHMVTNVTLGLSILFYLVTLAYLRLLASGHTGLASIALPLMTIGAEWAGVRGGLLLYSIFVVKPRGKEPASVVGCQRRVLQVIVAQAHGWAEATRAASLLAGCVKAPSDYLWIASLGMCITMNVLTRTGWTDYALSLLYSRIAGGCSVGSAMSKLHNHAKLTCGYLRHAVILSIVLSRLVVHQEVALSSAASPVFNSMAFFAMALLMLTEVMEDGLVHLSFLPDPPFREFHARYYAELPNYSLHQMVRTVRVDNGSGGRSPVVARNAKGRPFTTMSLHGAVYISRSYTVGNIIVIMVAAANLFELLLGVGYLRGSCGRPVSNIMAGIEEALLVTTPYSCP